VHVNRPGQSQQPTINVQAIAPFGDDALEPHHTGLPEHDCALDVLEVLVDPRFGVAQKARQRLMALAEPGFTSITANASGFEESGQSSNV
jgi:hypothetical protein